MIATSLSVATPTGDNCSTNRTHGRMIEMNVIGCHSHRFYSAVKNITFEKRKVVDKVQKLMRKLSHSLPSTMIQRRTLLRPKQKYRTRCSSTFQMLQRYCQLRLFLPFTDNFKAEKLLPIGTENDSLDVIMTTSSDSDSVAVELQSEATLTAEARISFDEVFQ